jgi:hypothetical protein
MTSETDQPNEFGFGGGATAPEPEPDPRPAEEVDGESIAVPAGDLTGAITHAIEDATDRDSSDSSDSPRGDRGEGAVEIDGEDEVQRR